MRIFCMANLAALALFALAGALSSVPAAVYGENTGNVCRDNVVGQFEGNPVGCLDSINTDF